MHYHVKDYSATVSGLSVLGYNSCADDSFLHSAFFHHFYAFFFMLKSHGGIQYQPPNHYTPSLLLPLFIFIIIC